MSVETTVLNGAKAMIINAMSNLKNAEDIAGYKGAWDYEVNLLHDIVATITERLEELQNE